MLRNTTSKSTNLGSSSLAIRSVNILGAELLLKKCYLIEDCHSMKEESCVGSIEALLLDRSNPFN